MDVRTIIEEEGFYFKFSHFGDNPFAESSELKVKGPQTVLRMLFFLFFLFFNM